METENFEEKISNDKIFSVLIDNVIELRIWKRGKNKKVREEVKLKYDEIK